jgi:hypothetical protein
VAGGAAEQPPPPSETMSLSPSSGGECGGTASSSSRVGWSEWPYLSRLALSCRAVWRARGPVVPAATSWSSPSWRSSCWSSPSCGRVLVLVSRAQMLRTRICSSLQQPGQPGHGSPSHVPSSSCDARPQPPLRKLDRDVSRPPWALLCWPGAVELEGGRVPPSRSPIVTSEGAVAQWSKRRRGGQELQGCKINYLHTQQLRPA